tara:strand:+ start:1267 stop:1731 length:465 start_codon:yes stop_codon:yes gene_type:complete
VAKIHIDDALIRHLAQLLDETGLTEIEVGTGRERLRVSRAAAAVSTSLVGQQAVADSEFSSRRGPEVGMTEEVAVSGGTPVRAPMVGTVYTAPEPEAAPFVSVGGKVHKGDTLFIIEAMKTMNPVTASLDGVVKEILIENGNPVEYDEILALVE